MYKIIALIALVSLLALSAMAQVEEKKEKKPWVSAKPKTQEVSKTEEVSATQPATSSEISIETELCSGIEERMPSGMADNFAPEIGTIYLWCKVLGAKDTTYINVDWFFKDSLMAEVELPVRSSSWRTWSSKNILPGWVGDWMVKVSTADGILLKSVPFKIAATEK